MAAAIKAKVGGLNGPGRDELKMPGPRRADTARPQGIPFPDVGPSGETVRKEA